MRSLLWLISKTGVLDGLTSTEKKTKASVDVGSTPRRSLRNQ
ncbi:hypothetical protein [Mucilaginibacter sp.]